MQLSCVFEELKLSSAEAEEKLKTEFNFLVDLKTSAYEASVDPNKLKLKISIRNSQKLRSGRVFAAVFKELSELFGSLFAGGRFLVLELLKKKSVDTLNFCHPRSTKYVERVACFGRLESGRILKTNVNLVQPVCFLVKKTETPLNGSRQK